MQAKGSAYYQRQYRQRLREQGLVKKEVWILPERTKDLLSLERQLRQPFAGMPLSDHVERGRESMKTAQLWTTPDLYEALRTTDFCMENRAEIEIINATEPCLHIVMREYGDLPVFLTVFQQQILVEALLWPVNDVRDPVSFNREVLRTHKIFPLSTIGIETLADGTEYYAMFGALSASSILSNVVFEVETLADNVIKATEAYEHFLIIPA